MRLQPPGKNGIRSRIVGSLVLLSFTLALHATGEFVEVYGGTYDDRATAVLRLADGDLMVAGYSMYTEPFTDLLLSRFDSNGIHLWSKTMGEDNNDKVWGMIPAHDDAVIVAGETWNYGAGGSDFLLAKFDLSGNLQWMKTIGGSAYDDGHGIAKTADGGFAVLGKTLNYGSGNKFLVSKFDSAGTHLWSRTLKAPGQTYTQYDGQPIAGTQDGGLAVTGMTWISNSYHTLLAKLDSSGTLEWARTLGSDSSDYAYSVIEAGNGDLLIAGTTNGSGLGKFEGMISRFSASGTHLWSRTVGREFWDFFTSVVEAPDGSLVMTGSSWGFYGNNYDVLVFRMVGPDSLDFGVNIGYGGAGDDYGGFVSLDPAGGFLVSGIGFSSSGTSRNAVLATFDSTVSTCTGELMDFTVLPFDPVISTPDLTVNSVTPDIMTHSPAVEDFNPIKRWVCPLCGDANDDGYVTTADGYHILNYFGAGPQPVSCWIANVNGDGNLTPSDGYHLLNFFGSGPQIYCGPCEF
jgi:hypothetical protein